MNKKDFIIEVLADKRIVRTAFPRFTKTINVLGGKSNYTDDDTEEILASIQELRMSLGVPKNVLCTPSVYSKVKMKPILTAYLTQPQYCRAMLQIKACQMSKSMQVFEGDVEKAILDGFLLLKTDISDLEKKYAIIFE